MREAAICAHRSIAVFIDVQCSRQSLFYDRHIVELVLFVFENFPVLIQSLMFEDFDSTDAIDISHELFQPLAGVLHYLLERARIGLHALHGIRILLE